MDALEAARLNLLSPMVLAFVLGLVAVLVRSDLELPPGLYDALTIYLLLAIGLKGGAELSAVPLVRLLRPALATIALGALVPLWSYLILRRLGRFDVANASAIAAHYGSVSAMTFIACLGYLDALGVSYEGYTTALVAMLEVPAILVALALARRGRAGASAWGEVIGELLRGRSVMLLLGGLAIGWLSGAHGYHNVAPFFGDAFKGILTLFLLEMGMLTARRARDLRKAGAFLIGFGIVMPVLHGALGAILGTWSGLSLGGTTVLAVLAASASYIAAPAAVRIAIPEASPSLYLTASLAVTFPFNLVAGLPLYHAMARLLHGVR